MSAGLVDTKSWWRCMQKEQPMPDVVEELEEMVERMGDPGKYEYPRKILRAIQVIRQLRTEKEALSREQHEAVGLP